MVEADLILEHAAELATAFGEAPRAGKAQGTLRLISDAAVAVSGGTLVFVGETRELDARVSLRPGGSRLDVTGKTILPGFVDPHTHLPFAGSRATEFEQRLQGRTYQEIAAGGGGILSTVEQTRRCDPGDLAEAALGRLDRMLALGTTTCEAKSGYGLSLEAELKQLRVLRDLDSRHPVEIVPTFLGAHTLPRDRRSSRTEYVREVTEEMIPRVASEKLAEYCDVFCDKMAFTPAEAEKILETGVLHGLAPRVHADQLSPLGGAELAGRLRAASADHLEFISEEGIESLARAGVTAVLIPGANFFLMSPDRPPARRLVEAGVPVALATDLNPGTSMTESMPLMMVLACLELKLTAAEALTAATLNAAHSLGRGNRIGSLEEGKQADLQVLDIPGHHHLVYHFGVSHVDAVIKRGEVVFRRSPARWAIS